jgi:hypothetical protein
MAEWGWEFLKYIPGVVGAFTGPAALWWQYLTFKERRAERTPKARLTTGVETDGWHSMLVEFTNPLGEAFEIVRVKAVSPRDLIIAQRLPDKGTPDEASAGSSVLVSWSVKWTPDEPGKAAAKTTIFLQRSPGKKLSDVSMLFRARERSANRREFNIPAKAINISASVDNNAQHAMKPANPGRSIIRSSWMRHTRGD